MSFLGILPANRIQTSLESFSRPTAKPSKMACKLKAKTVKKSLKALLELDSSVVLQFSVKSVDSEVLGVAVALAALVMDCLTSSMGLKISWGLAKVL